jgi:hypothetical protein
MRAALAAIVAVIGLIFIKIAQVIDEDVVSRIVMGGLKKAAAELKDEDGKKTDRT